jgi:prefoldin alpha subunit
MDQQQIMQIQMMEQEANHLNQQLEIIDQNSKELHELNESLDELEKKDTVSIMAGLGKKIFLPVEIKEKKLYVEVGNKNYVKKTISETKEVIDEQVNKLGLGKADILEKLNSLQMEINNLMINLQKEAEKEQDKK